MINRKDVTVVVLSRNYSTGISVIRSLGEKGYTVDLIASAKEEGASKMAGASKYLRNYSEFVTAKVKAGDDDAVIQKLLEYASEASRLVLLPTDDYTASLVDKNRESLDGIFLMPGIVGAGSLIHYMNKDVQCKMAEAIGLKAPKCWVIDLRGELEVPSDMVYPCYAKPIESFSGYKREMKTCHNAQELMDHLLWLKERFSDRSFLVQEFVDIDEEIDIEGVAMDGDIVLPGVIHKEIVAGWEIGVPLAGDMRKFDAYPGLKEIVTKLIESYHYQGMFDLGINIVGGEYYFNEINLRSGGTNYVYNKSGVNLSDLFVQKILGARGAFEAKAGAAGAEAGGCDASETEAPRTEIPEFGKKYIYELQAYEDLIHNMISKETVDEWLKTADIRIMESAEDPEPTKIFYEGVNGRLRRKKYRDEIAEAALKDKGWDRQKTLDEIKAARERLGVTLAQYQKCQLWKYDPDMQDVVYDEYISRQARYKAVKQGAINEVVEATGWSKEEAERNIEKAKKDLGVKYKEYVNYELYKYSPEKQRKIYKKLVGDKIDKKTEVNPTKEKPLVVVLSRNYSTGLAVIRSLGAAGYPVDLVASAIKHGRSMLAASSKYVLNAVEGVSKKVNDGGDAELMDALLAYRGKYDIMPILFATDDYTASVMDQNRDRLKDIFVMPEIVGEGQGAMTHKMSKDVQSEIARKVGLLTPNEWTIDLMTIDEVPLPADLSFPVFCKPMESITGYKTEMKKCEDADELIHHLKDLKRNFAERSVLVQEFLPIDNEIDLGGVCLDQEIIIPAIIKKTHVAQYEKGVTLAGRVVPYEELGEIAEKTKEMLKEFHYFGMFDMEFNVVGDKLYFNEVNLRSGGPNYSYYMSGVNLPEIFVKAASGQEISEEEKKVKEFGKNFIYEKVAWDDYMHGFMSKRELDRAIKTSDIRLLLSPEDPKPGDFFTAEMKKKNKRETYKKCYQLCVSILMFFGKLLWPILKNTPLTYPQYKKKNARNPLAEKPRVMVAGRNYLSNLCMAKSLGEAGYEVEVLKIFQTRPKLRNIKRYIKPDAFSKYVKAYYHFVSKRKPENIRDFLIEVADRDRKMLLIPCDDLVASVADAYYDDLKEYYVLPSVNKAEGEINRLMEKNVQKELARAAGLPVIGSCVIKSVGRKFEIPQEVKYPCFIKPNVSKNSAKSKMRRCDSFEDLNNTLLEYSSSKDFEMIVEDFVNIKREFSILGVSTKDGANGPGYFGAVCGGQKEHRGVAVTGEIIPTEAQKELIDKCVEFMGTLGFDGLYDIDLIEDMDGKMYFVEVNMRFGASGYAFTKLGCNLPAMFADYMLNGTPIEKNPSLDRYGDIFVSEKVNVEEYASGRLTKREYNKHMKEAQIHFIKDKDDPRPYRHFRRRLPFLAIVRLGYIASGKNK